MKSQIVFVEENGLSKPHFCCHHCSKVIKDASTANILWKPEAPQETIIVCKEYACERPDKLPRGYDLSMQLDVAWCYLRNNSGIDKQSELNARQLAHI
jgi:hypothetical protein